MDFNRQPSVVDNQSEHLYFFEQSILCFFHVSMYICITCLHYIHAFFNCIALNVCSSAFILCFIPIIPEFLCALFPSFWFLAFLYYVFSCMAFFLYYSSFTVSHTSKHFKLLVAHLRTYMRNRLDHFATLLKIDPVMIMKSSNA